MPAIKKTSKTSVVKTAVKAPAKVAKPATQAMRSVPPPAAPIKASASPFRTITQAERQRMIEEAAYYRAERAGFTGDPDEHWNASEKEIDARLVRENIRVA